MPKKNEVSIELQEEIMCLQLEGKLFGQIDVATGVPRTTWFRIIDWFLRHGDLSNTSQNGRLLKLSSCNSHILICELIKNPYTPLVDIVEGSRLNILVTTARRYKKKL